MTVKQNDTIDNAECDRIAAAIVAAAPTIARVLAAVRTAPPSEPASPGLVGPSELAKLLTVSVDSVARLAAAKRIPFVMVGTRRRYDVAAVRAALEAPKKATAKPLDLHISGVTRLSRGAR